MVWIATSGYFPGVVNLMMITVGVTMISRSISLNLLHLTDSVFSYVVVLKRYEMMMLDENSVVRDELQLHDYDFPSNYVNMAHPDDYIDVEQPKLPEFTIVNTSKSTYRTTERWACRIWFSTTSDRYFPMSFVVDTGIVILIPYSHV